MAFVLVDIEAFKITLEIVEDFINFDFQGFLEKDFDDTKPRIITWEMNIFLKLLNDQNKGFVNYYLLQIKKELEDTFDIREFIHTEPSEKQTENHIKTFSDSTKINGEHFITPEIQVCKNPALIKIIFYCKESTIFTYSENFVQNEYLKKHEELRKITYLNQMKELIFCILSDLQSSEYSQNLTNIKRNELFYYAILNSSFNNLKGSEDFDLIVIMRLHYIALIHYNDVIANLTKIFHKFCSNFNTIVLKKLQELTDKNNFHGTLLKISKYQQKTIEKSKENTIKIIKIINTVNYVYKLPNMNTLDKIKNDYAEILKLVVLQNN